MRKEHGDEEHFCAKSYECCDGGGIGRLNDVKRLYDSPTTGVTNNENGVLLPDGGLLTLTRRERADKSTYELVVFRVDGF